LSISRRFFLKSGLLLTSFGTPSSLLRILPQTHSSFDPWVEVHSENLQQNVAAIRQRVGGKPILAVIKNNGYGLGVLNVARILEPLPTIACLAVVKLQEAVVLRDGGIVKPILLMGPFDERNLEEMIARDIMPMVYTPVGSLLEKISAKRQKPVSLHLCVDTGIGRVGVPYRQAPDLIRGLASRSALRIDGTMMTFTEDQQLDEEQFARFQSLCRQLEREGINLGRKHAVSSFGLFQHADKFLDMVRPGMAIYGIYPEKEFRNTVMELRPAVSLKARVIVVKQLRKGESAGYNRAYVAQNDVWVATLPVGHADGLPRVATKGARIRIGTQLHPVVAISASHTIVELGAETSVNVGDAATVFDWQEGSRPEDFAFSCGGSVYDLTMHLNPLLPRTIV